jgi:anaerobic glycerol-3-phosphate dehydrogenase
MKYAFPSVLVDVIGHRPCAHIIIIIEAKSEIDAIKEFKHRHPYKKFRLLDPLDK